MADVILESARWLGVSTTQMQHISDETLTQDEAAQYLGVSVGAIDKMAAAIGLAPTPSGGDEPIPVAPTFEEPVPEGTVAEVMQWVGTDVVRAAAALEAERAAASPRSTLITQLEAIVNA